jgi:hypothetical protein
MPSLSGQAEYGPHLRAASKRLYISGVFSPWCGAQANYEGESLREGLEEK